MNGDEITALVAVVAVVTLVYFGIFPAAPPPPTIMEAQIAAALKLSISDVRQMKREASTSRPSLILPVGSRQGAKLYLGNGQTARDGSILKKLRITKIVNATQDYANTFEPSVS
jgi:hypothetical protein